MSTWNYVTSTAMVNKTNRKDYHKKTIVGFPISKIF